MTVGERIRKHRKKAGMTLRELSEKTGISIGYLCDIEHGRRQEKRSNSEMLYEIARALNVRIEILLGKPLLREKRQD